MVHLQYTDLKSWLSAETLKLEKEPGKLRDSVVLLPLHIPGKLSQNINKFNSVKMHTEFIYLLCLMANYWDSRKQIHFECRESYISFPLSTVVVNRARHVLGYSPYSGEKVFVVTVLQAPQIPG